MANLYAIIEVDGESRGGFTIEEHMDIIVDSRLIRIQPDADGNVVILVDTHGDGNFVRVGRIPV